MRIRVQSCGWSLTVIAALLTSSCATIGSATPKLSAEIGSRSAELQALHERAIRGYFAGERRRVLEFVDRVWVPQFLRNFIGTTHIVEMLVAAPAGAAAEEPAALMLEWAQDAQAEMDAKRNAMLAPILESEQSVLAELSQAYGDLRMAQALLTARLEAAAKLKDEQDTILKDVGVDKTFANVKTSLAKVSDAVGKALAAAEGEKDAANTAATLGKTLRAELSKPTQEPARSAAPNQ